MTAAVSDTAWSTTPAEDRSR